MKVEDFSGEEIDSMLEAEFILKLVA